ncbi:hypothetical protein ES703_66099 [subsurface metagenome]
MCYVACVKIVDSRPFDFGCDNVDLFINIIDINLYIEVLFDRTIFNRNEAGRKRIR